MHGRPLITVVSFLLVVNTRETIAIECIDYAQHSKEYTTLYSQGRYGLSSQRPASTCRTFISKVVEQVIKRMKSNIKDPDLYRLFSNSFTNTLDTTVK